LGDFNGFYIAVANELKPARCVEDAEDEGGVLFCEVGKREAECLGDGHGIENFVW
jgi:hypothetical protein